MSDAIRDVVVRVRIEQVDSPIKPPDFSSYKNQLAEIAAMQRDIGQQARQMFVQPATFQEQASGYKSIADAVSEMDMATKAATANSDPFANIDASVTKLKASMQEQAATFDVVDAAATKNFQSMLNIAQAESVAERAAKQASVAQRALNIELITATGSALRSAAASGDYASVTAQLGQALIYSLRGLAQQSTANVATATTAGAAATASGFQAVAVGAVGAAGARAATANAAVAASNVAVGATAAGATPAIFGMTLALGPIAAIVTGITVAVAVGKLAWDSYVEASRTGADDIRDAVKQRLDAEKQSEQVEAAIDAERRRRRGWFLVSLDAEAEKLQKLKTIQQQTQEAQANSFQGRLALNADDPNMQLKMLREKSHLEDSVRTSGNGLVQFGGGDLNASRVGAAALHAAKQSPFEFRNLEGTDRLKENEKLLGFLEQSKAFIDDEKTKQEKTLDIRKQLLQIGQQDAASLKGRLATIQEMISAEQGRLQSAAERFAQMDPGEQARLKEVAQKAKNGGELNIQEAQLLSQSGVGQGFASQAFDRIAKKAGFNDVAENLGEFNQIEQLRFQGNGAKEALAEAEKGNRDTKAAIQEIESAMKGTNSLIADLITAVRAQGDETERLRVMFGNNRTKGRDSSPVGNFGNRVGN